MKTTLLFLSVFLTTSLFGQYTQIPDPNFEQVLIQMGWDDVIDGQVLTANISGVTHLNADFCNISDLTGIEAFTSLIELKVFGNNLTSLDISQNTALNYLDVLGNQLTSLDVSQNTLLTNLICYGNNLTSLDVSQNTALEELVCFNNQLTSLDVSQNTVLMMLFCGYNELTCLNALTGNNNPVSSFDAQNNPNLTCIEVDNPSSWYSLHSTNIDPQTSFSENCNNNCSNTSSLTELTSPKQLLRIVDLMGREVPFKPNTPLIYLYDDGSTERVFKIE